MLKTISFPEKSLQLQRLYQNEMILEQLKSEFAAVPDKVRNVYGPIGFPEPPPGRPYLTGCLALSMDGRTGYESDTGSRTLIQSNRLDKTDGLTDLWMVNLVRTYADAVLLGSTTLHEEPDFTGHIYDSDLQAFRMAHPDRFRPVPWNVLITRGPADLPWEHPVLTTPEIPVLLIVPETQKEALVRCPGHRFCYLMIDGTQTLDAFEPTLPPVPDIPRHLVVTLPEQKFPGWDYLFPLLRVLGVRQMTVESPHWITKLMADGLLDEFFLTYTGVYTGGSQTTGQDFQFMPSDAPVVSLASLHLSGTSVLMTRQIMEYNEWNG